MGQRIQEPWIRVCLLVTLSGSVAVTLVAHQEVVGDVPPPRIRRRTAGPGRPARRPGSPRPSQPRHAKAHAHQEYAGDRGHPGKKRLRVTRRTSHRVRGCCACRQGRGVFRCGSRVLYAGLVHLGLSSVRRAAVRSEGGGSRGLAFYHPDSDGARESAGLQQPAGSRAGGDRGVTAPAPALKRARAPACRRSQSRSKRSGVMLRRVEPPGPGRSSPLGASPAPARRRSVGAGDGLLDGALLIDATSMTRVEVRHDLVIAGRRCLHRLADPATSRSTGWRPAHPLHNAARVPVPQGVQGAPRLRRPMLACPGSAWGTIA